eukprot:CAMPEP_0172719264 /NCGR_PEP_ID=MMETSP1074-20121228/75407_1 /TAXON_ID=2916 /ORGANISM="Ceratium fusus, Strain PA161109" /LENGTH=100 /DNA_ID=CAMNT_0013544599 /DNA_START=33 /DNA_END=332 /DNA_ORIENTATION=-
MHGTRHAILHFHVKFGEHEGLIHACIADVALGGCIHNVAYLEAFHSFVLWHAPPAIAASDNCRVTAAMFAPPIVAALGRHDELCFIRGVLTPQCREPKLE